MKEEISKLLGIMHIEKLNPMQTKALPHILGNKNILVSAPTASGKTLLAEIAMIKNRKEGRGKIIYIVPLRALASEKYKEFSETLGHFGISVGISTGDFDSVSESLAAHDVIIVTSEKMDSLLRHKAKWIKNIGGAIIDEIHLLGDASRGATLEIVISKLRKLKPRIIGLSATVNNSAEIAEWLNAELIESNYRPTKLVVGVCDKEELEVSNKKIKIRNKERALEEIIKYLTQSDDKQIIVFVSTRKSAEKVAEELAGQIGRASQKLQTAKNKILKVLSTPTIQCKRLASVVGRGVAFHHAGILQKQRDIIEEEFKKEREIKIIVATTTLAMGIDYPASIVIVRNLKRFSGAGSQFLPNLEVQQMLGRAGRPRYDKEGVGILMTKSSEKRKIIEKYIMGPLENIYSQLSSEPALRTHTLSLIASEEIKNFNELFAFFNTTLFAHQYQNLEVLYEKIENIVDELVDYDFVRMRKGALVCTPVGRRISELYIDPLSGAQIVEFLERKIERRDIDYLMLIAGCAESRPLLNISIGEERKLWEELYEEVSDFEVDEIRGGRDSVRKYKTAKMLNAWINEKNEEEILEEFRVPPGELFARRRNAEWLAYSINQIAWMLNKTEARKRAAVLEMRLRYGIKEELLELCSLRGIGRVRARKLFNAGIKTKEKYKKLAKEERERILRKN